MNKPFMSSLASFILSIILGLSGLLSACVPQTQLPTTTLNKLNLSLAGDFQKAQSPASFRFPTDMGSHDNFQTEWWYYTGNLETDTGRRFGYQLTFFRRAVIPPSDRMPRTSDWAVDQIFLAHFTVSDIENNHFYQAEKVSRGAAGLAGAQGQPEFSVWLENWQVQQVSERSYQIHAETGEVSLSMEMEDLKGIILQGDQGYSQKGPETGNASYYTSQTRLKSQGKLRIDGEEIEVQGLSWMDHEYSTSALGKGEVGWNWFSIQLDDNTELMLFTIRDAKGKESPFSSAALILNDGSKTTFSKSDFIITSTNTWVSPHSKVAYPSSWEISIPSQNITLVVQPLMADQEVRLAFTYWEGAVRITGSINQKPVSGSGYVELTGYAQSMEDVF